MGEGSAVNLEGEITWGCHVLPLQPEGLGFSGSLRDWCGLSAAGASVGQGQVHDHLGKLTCPDARQRGKELSSIQGGARGALLLLVDEEKSPRQPL